MSKSLILVDADYLDNVAFDLIVNFERIIGRPIPKADMARWIDCVALDGGLREKKQDGMSAETGSNEVQVVLIHNKQAEELKNFMPSNYEEELNGKAFKDHLGEFSFGAYPVEELTTKEDFFLDTLQTVCQQKETTQIMIIPDDSIYNNVRELLYRLDDDTKHITVFTMQPLSGGPFRQEILGYSLMSALGIRSEEIPQ